MFCNNVIVYQSWWRRLLTFRKSDLTRSTSVRASVYNIYGSACSLLVRASSCTFISSLATAFATSGVFWICEWWWSSSSRQEFCVTVYFRDLARTSAVGPSLGCKANQPGCLDFSRYVYAKEHKWPRWRLTQVYTSERGYVVFCILPRSGCARIINWCALFEMSNRSACQYKNRNEGTRIQGTHN